MDERVKQLLKELGDAINESISESAEVNDRIQKIRDEGYNLYVVLDATIGLDREDEEESSSEVKTQITASNRPKEKKPKQKTDIQFRINVQDLAFLRSVGIDPTRKVKAPKKLEGHTTSSDGNDEQS